MAQSGSFGSDQRGWQAANTWQHIISWGSISYSCLVLERDLLLFLSKSPIRILQLLYICSCWFSAWTAWNGSDLLQSDTDGTSRANPSVRQGRNFPLLPHPWSQSCFLSFLVLSWLLFQRDQTPESRKECFSSDPGYINHLSWHIPTPWDELLIKTLDCQDSWIL